MSAPSWKERLAGQMPPALADEIDVFETQMVLRQQGKLDEKVFAETRLRRGIYGQRYDNGKRHDGNAERTIPFPCGGLTKGPETMWDAPGMMRIKIPMGQLTAQQLDVLAELAEEYSDSILHVTTRQDIQLHFVVIDDTPDLMRRLAAVGITTREACGNSVRNVTACQFAGVCSDRGLRRHALRPRADLLPARAPRHPGLRAQVQDRVLGLQAAPVRAGQLPRHRLHRGHPRGGRNDPARLRVLRRRRAGRGAATGQAARPVRAGGRALPLAQAVCRVFARLGERKNRARARLKFVVQKLGIDEFRKAGAGGARQGPAR